jgi:hypothetical protein
MRKPVVVLVAAGVAAASLAGLGIAAASSATANSSAQDMSLYIKKAATSYSAPTNQSAPVHYGLKEGEMVTVRCFTEGQELGGNHYWLKIGKDGKLGFVHRDSVALIPGIPHCP